jgi:glycosyltransferase involved in cell wall biosynthesis
LRRAAGPGEERIPLSVIITTLNEESNIVECLRSIQWAAEVLVVDSGSTDRTVELATPLADRILTHPYDTPARQKNWAIPQAAHEWVLLVDADERVTPALRDEILAILARGPESDGYWIRRANFFIGRQVRHCGWGGDTVIRLFRRDVSRYQDRKVHAEIDLPGPLPTLEHPLEHHTFRSFGQYWRKIDLYSDWGARQMYLEGRRTGGAGIAFRTLGRFIRMYILKRGFLEGAHGVVLSLFGAFTVYLKYARLWELQIAGRAPDAAASGPASDAAGPGPLVGETEGHREAAGVRRRA